MAYHFRSAMRVAVISAVTLLGALVLTNPVAAAGNKIYVSPHGSPVNSGVSCPTAKYTSINDGIAAAPDHGTVIVCRGTYYEMAVVNKPLTLEGRQAVIDATGLDNGILITHSWVTVERFSIHGATGEGILAMGDMVTNTSISHVLIQYNAVSHNDQGGPDSSYRECQPQGEVPGDCGEAIHLMSVADSTVWSNAVTDNAGGILLSDEFGPTHGNTIAGNLVQDNPYDCGITLASHNAGWDPVHQTTMPDVAGVYDNLIRGNVVRHNGYLGEGAGVLMAGAFPLAAVYDNHVDHNFIISNNLAGVTIHSHTGGGYVDGNVITHNRIGPNNQGGDPDAGVSQTTGVLVYSSDQNISVTINHNLIFGDHFGIWLSSSTVTATTHHNVFLNVAVPIQHG